MALSGPEALRSLDSAVRDVRAEENTIAKRLSRSAERVAKLRETQAELFRQLAEVRLSPDVRAELSGRLIQAEERAYEMIAQHSRSLAEAQETLEALDENVAEKTRERRKILAEIDDVQLELKSLAETIAQTIAKDPVYEAKRLEAEELDRIASQSMTKTEVAETDKLQKGRPYREDSLFMYLWEAGYGTRSYKANNLVRWLDGLVARMIRYHDARPNFAMLNEIPMRLREHAERQMAHAAEAEEELDALEQSAIDDAGGKPVRERLARGQDKLSQIDEEMSALEDERDQQARNLRHMAEGRDPAFEEAERILAHSLGQQDIGALLASARVTHTPEDDVIVAKIDDVRARITDEAQETADHKERLKTLSQRRRELEDIEWEFKKARFDDPRSVFREDDLAGDLLGEFLRGAISASSYWGQWQKSQSWRPGTSDWGGGIGLPRSGRKPRRPSSGFTWPTGGNTGGGGFSRPRKRTGSRGSRKSGGFKTGGGF